MTEATSRTPLPDGSHAAESDSYASRKSFEFGRGISFLDAIYGFAATLLISNVDAPPAEAWKDLPSLAQSGLPTQVFGFALSFAVIAVFWRANARVTRQLRGIDGPTMFLNLMGAALVILLAFTTQGISDPDSAELALPTALYAANIALVALILLLMFEVGRARGLERHPLTRRQNGWYLVNSLMTPMVFLASIPVAILLGATPAKLVWASLFVLGPLGGVLAARAKAEGGRRSGRPRSEPAG
jgi:uncharacterized membrane protein